MVHELKGDVMPKGEYKIFEALNPFFEVVIEGLCGLVDGDHCFDTIAEDAFFEFRYQFPAWPLTIRGRANRKIVLWRDYMDSLAAWNALNGSS
jgi:ketosteroid isomerase-like protein